MYKIGVVGLGFVGLAHAAVFSSLGFKVVGIDIDKWKINNLLIGRSPIGEPGLEDLIRKGLVSGNLVFDYDYERLVKEDVDLIFIAVNTATKRYNQSLDNLVSSVESIGNFFMNYNKPITIVLKSTVLPGVSRRIVIPLLEEKLGNTGFFYVFNPEFLREGSAVYDVLYPSRIVIGEYNKESGDLLVNFYKDVYRDTMPPIIRTSIEAAELSKYASNLFLACKLSFINSVAYICENLQECDVLDIKRIMGLDERIGSKYLHPGIGFGGSCLPKDLKAFIGFVRDLKPYELLFRSIDEINDYQAVLPVKKSIELLGSLKDRIVTVLGLSYKGGVDDVRGSRSIILVREFLKNGAIVKIYDPKATENFISYISKYRWYKINKRRLVKCGSIKEAIKDSDFIVIATDWDEFKTLDPDTIIKNAKTRIIYDGRRILDPQVFKSSNIRYYGIGRGCGK